MLNVLPDTLITTLITAAMILLIAEQINKWNKMWDVIGKMSDANLHKVSTSVNLTNKLSENFLQNSL